MNQMSDAPEPIRGNEPGSFAEGVLTERHPALIRQVAVAHPYPPEIRARLEAVGATLQGEIPALDLPWAAAGQPAHHRYAGQRWLDVPWLTAEALFYRVLLEAVGYHQNGPWHGIDPFGPQKSTELADDGLADELAGLRTLLELPTPDALTAATDAAVWANRADLGFGLSDPEARHRARVEELVVNDSEAMWAYVRDVGRPRIAVIADNAGRELLADLVWIDRMLALRHARQVDLHVKPDPYFISDATTADVLAALRVLDSVHGAPSRIADRLRSAMITGELRVRTDPFWCTFWSFDHLPEELVSALVECDLTVLKGDLNYRKLVGDRHWPATSPFAELTEYFPTPLVTFRTLKSDVVVGLSADQVATLDATGQPWRTNGTHALIQANLG